MSRYSSLRLLPRHSRRLLFALIFTLFVWLAPGAYVPRASADGPYMYVANAGGNNIIRAGLTGLNPSILPVPVDMLNSPYGIAVDNVNSRLYITDRVSSIVIRTDLSGHYATVLPIGVSLNQPKGIAIDPVNGYIYIADWLNDRIVRADLDGGEAQVLHGLDGQLHHPAGVAIDTTAGYMYITNYGEGIVRASLDGSSPTDLYVQGVTLSAPMGIALDTSYRSMMYIANAGSDAVVSSHLNGTTATTLPLPAGLLDAPAGIALDSSVGRLYVASWFNSKLAMTTSTGDSALDMGSFGGLLNAPYDVALHIPADLQVTLTDNVAGTAPLGGTFDWNVNVDNHGGGPAVFRAGQVILRNHLPAGPTYVVSAQTASNVTNAANIVCSIASNILTCTANGGPVGFGSNPSSLYVRVSVTPTSLGTLLNPSGGACAADPDGRVAESDETNNTAADTVNVVSMLMAYGKRMYVTNANDSISRANLEGAGGNSLGNPAGLLWRAGGVAVDTVQRQLYLISMRSNRIVRSNLDGSGGLTLLEEGLIDAPLGIALDVPNGKMYIANFATNRVVQANLDGTADKVLANLNGTVDHLYGIALDPVNHKVYVAGQVSSNVVRMNTDPNNPGVENLGNIGGLLNAPYAIALDPAHGRMFVVNYVTSKIVSAKLDGTNPTDLGTLGGLLSWPTGIALDPTKGQMYISSSYNTRIVRANLDGSGATDLGNFNGTLNQPMGIALDLSPLLLHLPFVRR